MTEDDEIKTPPRILALAKLAGLALAHGVSPEAADPVFDTIVDIIDDTCRPIGPGKRPRDASYSIALGVLCAAIMVLKKGRGVAAATALVATKIGYPRAELVNFYGRLNRGRADGLSSKSYRQYIAKFRGMTEAEILKYLCA